MVYLELKNKPIKYKQVLGIGFIFLIFFFLRLYRLGYHDFWYDEIGSIGYAQYPWKNWNAPLYWVLLHFWIKIFAISEFSLRFPSLVFSFLSIILVYLLGKELFDRKTGIIASIFIGLSPFHLWYAQEARDYSMVLFFGTLSSYLLFKAMEEKGVKLWLFFALVSIIGVYTNYFYIFLLFAQGFIFILAKRRELDFKGITCFLIIFLGFSLYLPRFLSKFYFVWQGFWIPKPTWRSLLITLETYILGYNGLHFLYIISDILVIMCFISVFRIMCKEESRRSLILCMLLFLIPIICAFCFSKLFFSVYLDRGLIVFSPYFYLILASGIISLRKEIKVVLLILMILIILIAVYGYFKDWLVMPFNHHVGAYLKKPIRPLVKFLEDKIEPHDIVALTNDSILPSLNFYGPKIYPIYYFFNPAFLDTNWQRPISESEFSIPLQKINSVKAKRIWAISSNWERDGKLDENSQSVKNWLDRIFKLELAKEFEGLWIFRYSR